MEIALAPSFSLFLPVIATVLCFLLSVVLALFKLKSAKPDGINKSCICACSCNGGVNSDAMAATATASYMNGGTPAAGEVFERAAAPAPAPAAVVAEVAERQIGASMMEQLVPEITTHALSYLDYQSLCRLSMTNSTMRKAANDDNAWKALYHKDFTMEQDSVTPANGWKAYYAATRAIVNKNAEFFNIIRDRTLPDMGRLWLNVDYVKCVHASGELFSGYNAVLESWQLAFNWEPGVDFQIRDVRVRVLAEVAWVSMKAYVDLEHGPFNVTNVFELHNGRWYMVHHHSSAMLTNGEEAEQPPMLG